MLFKVIKVTPTKKGNHLVKVQNNSTVTVNTPFGDSVQNKQTTYYMFLQTAPALGFEAELDISKFNVSTQEFDAEGETGVVELKYLYPKSA